MTYRDHRLENPEGFVTVTRMVARLLLLYADEDEASSRMLQSHLMGLVRQGLIEVSGPGRFVTAAAT